MKESKSLMKFGAGAAAAALALVAAIVYAASLASYAFPGESARLMALWRSLDVSTATSYPLMAKFATMFGASNGFAAFLGVIAVLLVFFSMNSFLKARSGAMTPVVRVSTLSGAAVAAVVFLFTPAVREAATHLEPRLFDFVWAFLAVLVLVPGGRFRKVAWFFAGVSGVMAGLGLADSPLFLALVPAYLFAVWSLYGKKSKLSPFISIVVFIFAYLIAFFWFAAAQADDFSAFLRGVKNAFLDYFAVEGWLFVAVFATLPFTVGLFASSRSLKEPGGWSSWIFHTALTLVTILAIATPLSPSALMAPYAILPVATSAFAAFSAGYLVCYWLAKALLGAQVKKEMVLARYIGCAVGGIFAVVLLFTVILEAFNFERDRGDFADKVAVKVLEDMGERKWLVTDGSLDDHILLAAERLGKEINLVALNRDDDKNYISRLSAKVAETGLGGAKNKELALSLSLGVLPFVQDWFAADPTAKEKAAVWGAADLWLRANVEAIPEFLFFGADPARTPEWEKNWKEFSEILHAPEGWGSYRLALNKSPIERKRLDLRRHIGLIANNRGVWLEDKGRLDEAFKMFELVLEDIDSDNICALLNEFELANAGEKGALSKRQALERRLKSIVDDSSRRYRDIPLSIHYGYIRSPEMYVRHGFSWARSGRPGEALLNFGRAIDLVPTDRRTSLLNMMAAVYASENEEGKSRAIYEQILEKDAANHDALIGLMRLEMVNGNTAKAMEYLERANQVSGDDPRANVEKAMLMMMKGDLASAKSLLRKTTDADGANLQAWSFLAAVTIQQIDSAKDPKARAALVKELEDDILRTMEKQARDPSDYYVQTTRAFLLLRKGADNRREARDALIAAARDRPDVAVANDMILGLDISLNDTVDAERHAREVLRRNRKAPLANYVMGSLALQRGEYTEAEAFLRRAVDTERPVVLALNDLAEVLRRAHQLEEAESYARKATETDPNLYVAWDTLATIIMERGGDLDEAEKCVKKACELSRDEKGRETDVRMLISLARIQFAKKDSQRAKGTLRKVLKRVDELSEFEKSELEELRKSAK